MSRKELENRLKAERAARRGDYTATRERADRLEARVAALEARHRFPEGVLPGGLLGGPCQGFSAAMAQAKVRIHGNEFEEPPEPRCCPFCGSHGNEIIHGFDRHWVRCGNKRCEAAGRKRHNAAKAVEAWNMIESPIRTALDKPPEPGKFRCRKCQCETEKKCKTCEHWKRTGGGFRTCARHRCHDINGISYMLNTHGSHWCPDWEGRS